jgi:hypothetical protein
VNLQLLARALIGQSEGDEVDFAAPGGPAPTRCCNRFVRWRKAGVFDRTIAAVSEAYGGAVQISTPPRPAHTSTPPPR